MDRLAGNLISLADTIHVWWIPLNPEQIELANDFACVLDSDEATRARKFFFPLLRKRFIVIHGVLRTILSQYLNCGPESIRFSYGKFGKPFLAMNDLKQDLRFNLSHSQNYALLAVTEGREVGIDIEYVDDKVECDGVASMVFSPKEITMLDQVPLSFRRETFFIYWTRKEAFLKALGSGLVDRMNEITMAGLSERTKGRFIIKDPYSTVTVWTCCDLAVSRGYQACLVGEGEEFSLKHFDYTFLHRE